MTLVYNIVYNLGLIYNSGKNLITYFYLPARSAIAASDYYNIGVQIGVFVFNVFANP